MKVVVVYPQHGGGPIIPWCVLQSLYSACSSATAMSRAANHAAETHGQLAPKKGYKALIAEGGRGTICTESFVRVQPRVGCSHVDLSRRFLLPLAS